MIPTTHGLTLCVFFLLSLQKTVFSQRGSCVGNKCFAFFPESRNFLGALKRCKDSRGQIFKFSPTNEAQLVGLVGTNSGAYWLEVAGSGEEEEKTLSRNCSSIFVSMCRNLGVKQRPCRQELDGFLCQYSITAPCQSLQTGSGVQVSYNVTHMPFEIHGSEVFPQGTLAVAEKVGNKFPDSRHVCLEGNWMKAPWSCEVLGGGCDYSCVRSPNTCICPAGQSLHPNGITCTADPCAHCAHECNKDGDTPVCRCREGFRLAPDLKTCEKVSELAGETNPCTDETMEWDGSKCICRDQIYDEHGKCAEVSLCLKCEQDCVQVNGVDRCVCREGYRVSAKDKTKCEQYCPVRQCPAHCIHTGEVKTGCRCPEGYIRETLNGTVYCTDMDECDSEQCDHQCVNTFGSYSCLCNPGFKLKKGYRCVRVEGEEEEEEEDSGSGEAPPEAHPASGPSLVKTGSVLCVAVVVALIAVMLFFLVRHLLSRCGKFQLSSLKHRDIDIFYLQQVTAGTYQRFSSDRPLKNDPEVI